MTIDYLLAGNDIDVVVHDSIQGTDLGDVGDVLVKLYDPPDGLGAPPAGTPIPSGAGGTFSFADAESGQYKGTSGRTRSRRGST